jgi:hypothetical protein
MGPLSWIIFLLSIFCIIIQISLTKRDLIKKPFVSAYLIVILLFILYFIFPSFLILINNGEYTWATHFGGREKFMITQVVVLISLFIFCTTYHLVYSSSKVNRFRFYGSPSEFIKDSPSATLAAWILVILGSTLKVVTIFLSGGLETVITRLSGGLSNSLGVDSVSGYTVIILYLSGIADIGITWLLVRAIHKKEKIKITFFIFSAIILISFFITGKRLFLILPLISLSLSIHRDWKYIGYKWLYFSVLIILGIGFCSLMFRIYAPSILNGFEIDLEAAHWSDGSILKFYFYSLEFATFEFLSLNLFARETLIDFFGGSFGTFYKTNIEPFLYLVPRLFWSAKPEIFVDISHANSAMISSNRFGESGIASTILGTSFVIAGPIGLFFALAFLGGVSALVDKHWNRGYKSKSYSGILRHGFLLVFIFHFFRQGSLGWTAIIIVSQHLGMIIGLLIISSLHRSHLRYPKRSRSNAD